MLNEQSSSYHNVSQHLKNAPFPRMRTSIFGQRKRKLSHEYSLISGQTQTNKYIQFQLASTVNQFRYLTKTLFPWYLKQQQIHPCKSNHFAANEGAHNRRLMASCINSRKYRKNVNLTTQTDHCQNWRNSVTMKSFQKVIINVECKYSDWNTPLD